MCANHLVGADLQKLVLFHFNCVTVYILSGGSTLKHFLGLLGLLWQASNGEPSAHFRLHLEKLDVFCVAHKHVLFL